MKITFIFLHITPWGTAQYYSGIASLSAVLKKAGHDVSLLTYTKPIKEGELISAVSKQSPDLIGFSSNTHMFRYVKAWAPWLKKRFNIPIICGGAHPTIDPEDSINAQGIDMICIGEGENAMLELCRRHENAESIANIDSIWIKDDGLIIRNPVGPLVEDLDTLPFEDRGIFDYERLYASLNYTADVMASRGCPYNCSYCCNHIIRKRYPNNTKYVRFRGVDNIIEELKEIIAKYPFTRFIRFFDDILPLNKRWFKEFAEKYSREIALPFSCQSRTNLIDREVAELLKHAGCYIVRFGVESGNDHIRNEILNRNITKEQIINAFHLCKERGIVTRANYIIGSPSENMSTVLDSIRLNAKIRPNKILPGVFYPYPGSKAYHICKEKGFLIKNTRDTLLEGPVICQETISWGQVCFAFESFLYIVKVYSLLSKLPRFLKVPLIRMLDSIYCSKMLPCGPLATILRLRKKVFYKLTLLLKVHTPRLYSVLRSGRGTSW